jgi:aminocarboxymuconate-semialdehyde decarboxylase
MAKKPVVIDFHAHFMTEAVFAATYFYYETVVFNPDVLETLATKTDASHIMLGSDFPFGESKPVEFLQTATKISTEARDAILGANAAKFLGLKI